ncbi:hypothetical protein D3C80_1993550 [compost metagenome]
MKIGKYKAVASNSPSINTGLRPTLSDSQPKKMKNGAPMVTLMISKPLATAGSILRNWVRKNST